MPDVLVPTAEILQRLGTDCDADSWRQLVEQHGESMYRAAYAVLRDPDLASDACQDAFLHVRASAKRFVCPPGNGEFAARAWLLRVATSAALRFARSER